MRRDVSTMRRRSSTTRRRRRGFTGSRVGFLIARLSLIAIAAVLSVVILTKLSHPYLLHWSENKGVVQDTARRDALNSDNERLLRRKEYLNTPAGETAQARSLGYHYPDESPLRVQDSQGQPAKR